MIDFHSQLEEQFPGKNYIPTVYNSAELQDNLEHSGGITISWNAATDDEIPLGAYVKYPLPAADQTEAEAGTLRYILLDPYAPSKESAIPHYQYQPQFKHPQNMLDRIPFWIKSLDASGSPINLKTTSYTGFPYIIAQKLCDFINSEYVTETGDSFFAATVGNTWTYEIPGTINSSGVVISSNVIITVSFDGCSIKSAANAIADAMGCNVYWDWKAKKIRFVVGSTIQGETYNCFHVLGGTTNMGKTLVSGGFAAVTQRLTLPYDPEHPTAEGSYPGSIISRATSGGIRLTTDLIFDDIYPKQELYIKSARQRLCYLTDENGEFIVDHWEKDGQIVEEGTDGATPVYKTFAKWYVTFKNADGTDYDFDQSLLIQDQPLGLLFQIDYDHPQVMSALVGQQFELTYYPTRQKEHDRNDVSSEFIVEAGEFFIAVKAVGNVILPYTMNSQAKGTVDMAYSTLPPASAEYDGQTAIVSNQNRIYSCILNPEDDEYEWGVLKTVSGGDIYIVNHGNLDGTYTSPDTLNGTAIIWNATGNKWDVYGNMLFPCVGDKVTLVNMALSPEQISDAKDELLAAANEIINAMTTPSGEYQETIVLNKSHYNTGGIITSVSVGEETIFERDVEAQDRKHGPVVTQIQQNIDTGIVQVTVGSWTRKTKTGGTVDKLETVSVSSSSPTNGGDSFSDGSIGEGGGYSGSSGKETETINQTILKPDSLFLATLGNTIDAVSCDSEGKVRIESDIYSYITGKYGTKDVTTSCEVSVSSLPPVQPTQTAGQNLEVEIYVTDRNGDETRITQLNTAYELIDEKRWLRFHFPVGYDMAYEKDGVKVLDDSLTQLFSIGHPAFTDRGLSMTIQAMREGAEGIGGAFKSRVFCRFNPTAQKSAPSTPTGGDYNHPWPGGETPHTATDDVVWYDGIPGGTAQIWSSVATFTVNGSTPTWSTPQPDSDTANIDIEFSPNIDCPADPTGDDPNVDNTSDRNAQGWYDPLKNASTQDIDWSAMIWRAERKVSNGQYVGGWTKSRIKGEQGAPAGNTATIYLYKRGASVDDVWGSESEASTKRPNRTLYYKFESKTLYYNSDCAAGHEVTSENGWCPQMPSGDGRLFVTAATAYNTNAYDDVASGEWADPIQYNGEDGADGFNTATIFVYKRAASVANDFPFNGTVYYKFADGKLYTDNTFATEATFNTGWSRDIPATDTDHNPCWVRQAVALSKEAYDAILKTTADNDWSDPAVKLVEDGADGTSPYFADIDNEMDSVACDANGNTTTGYDVYIGVHVWHGSTEEDLTKLQTNSITGFTITPDAAHKRIRVQVTSRTLISQVNTINITIASADSGDKTLHFVLNGVRPGADGVTPTLFSLVPNTNVIVKKKDGTTNVEYVSCSVGAQSAINNAYGYEDYPVSGMEQEGDTVLLDYSSSDDMIDVYTEGSWEGGSVPLGTLYRVGSTIYEARENGWYAYTPEIRYQIDGGTEQPYSTQISVSLINNNIRFRLLVEDVQRDVETIPVVADGDDAVGYEIDFSQDTIVIPSDQSSVTIAAFTGTFYEVVGSTRTQKMSAFVLWKRKTDGTYERVMYHRNAGGFERQDLVVDDDVEALVVTLQETLTNNPSVYYYKQEVPVLKNGDSGESGDDAPYYKDEYALSSSRSSHPSEDDSSWSPNQPSPTEQAPYVWKRSRLFDPNTSDWATGSSWVYVCLTGEDGGQGPQGNAYTLKTSPSQLIYNPTTTNWVGSSGFRVSRLNNGQTSSEGTLTVYHVDSNGTRGNAITPVNEVYSPSSSDSRCDVVWTINNAVVAEVSVAIVKFGEQGGTGHVGRWYYFAGEYSGTPGDYEMEETQAPYVYTVSNNTKLFWMLDFKGENPASGVATEAPSDSSTQWTRMQSEHEYYIARAYFGDSAYLGSFIINGDWMISQQGTLNGGTLSPAYLNFTPITDPNDPNVGTFDTTKFVPNFAVNGANGKVYMNDAHVRGEIEAQSGHIGGDDGWAITAKHLQSGTTGSQNSMHLATEDFYIQTGSGSDVRNYQNLRLSVGSKFFINNEGEMFSQDGKFIGGLSTYDGFVEIDESLTQGSYTWRGIAIKFSDANMRDLATFGARDNHSLVSYGRLILTRRNANGNYPTHIPVEISGEDGSAKFEGAVLAGKYRVNTSNIVTYGSADGDQRITDANCQVVIKTDAGDSNVYLESNPGNGTVIMIKRQNGSGITKVYENSVSQNKLIGEFNQGCLFCVYYNGWI